MPENTQHDAEIELAVQTKLLELDCVPAGAVTDRRLGPNHKSGCGASLAHAETRELVRAGMICLAQRFGLHFFAMTPAPVLEQLVLMAVAKEHDAAMLIQRLLSSFLIAYITPETSDAAVARLDSLESLRRAAAGHRFQTGVTGLP